MHERALVALGSNVGDRVAMLTAAVEGIDAMPGVRGLRVSALYETPAVTLHGVGQLGDPDAFLNAAAIFETDAKPHELLDALLALEAQLGRLPRDQRETWGPRPIDLDLLALGQRRIDEPELTIPHPRITQRWFVLAPLADLVPDWVLSGDGDRPARKQTVRDWLDHLQRCGGESVGAGRPCPQANWPPSTLS